MFYFRHTNFFNTYLSIPEAFYFKWRTGLTKARIINTLIFTSVIFLVYVRKRLKELPVPDWNVNEALTYSALSIIVIISQYLLKFVIKTNLAVALKYHLLFAILKYLFNIAFVLCLIVACYGKNFLASFIRHFRNEIIIFSTVGVVYYFLILIFQNIWFPLSRFVAMTLYKVFSMSFDNTYINFDNPAGPRLGVNGFIVGISKDCSGIDSLLLFISLFVFLIVLNWKELNMKHMFVLFWIGLVGTILYNILRIYLLILVGVFISPEFAVDAFHSNIGWILFLAFFAVFWNFGSRYAYKK